MSYLRVAVLNASHQDANTKRNFRRELDASLTEFDVTSGRVPASTDFDAVVVTGSRSSVYWDETWIANTKDWVGKAIDRKIPFLGICWGHQLLAEVLGGTVSDMGEYEVGYSEIRHFGNSRLFRGIDRRFTAFTSHSDAVVDLPPGATPLAENEYSNHGFRSGRVFGVQFHPEYDVESARDLVDEKDLTDERRAAVLAEITAENYAKACPSKLVFENFLEFVREGHTEESRAETRARGKTSETDTPKSTDTRNASV